MNRIQTYFRSVWGYLTKPEAYRDVPARPFRSSWKYLYHLCTLLSLLVTIPLTILLLSLLPIVNEGVQTFREDAVSLFPKELILTVSDGALHTNMDEPYLIEFPERWKKFVMGTDNYKNNPVSHFFVINTTSKAEDYLTMDTFVLLTKQSIVFRDRDKGIRVMPYTEFLKGRDEYTFNRAEFDAFLLQINPFLSFIVPLFSLVIVFIALALPFSIGFTAMFVALFWLLFLSLILWAASAFMNKGFGYKQVYKLGVYGYTVPACLTAFMHMIGLSIPYLPTLVFLGWMLYVLHELPSVLPLAGVPPMPSPPLPVLPSPAPVSKKPASKKSQLKPKS